MFTNPSFLPFRPLKCSLTGGGVPSRAWAAGRPPSRTFTGVRRGRGLDMQGRPAGCSAPLTAGSPPPCTLSLGGGRGLRRC